MGYDYHAPYHPYIAVITIMILVVVLVFFVLSIVLLLHQDYWQFPVQKLAANSMIGHFILSLIMNSTNIHLYLLYKPLGKVWCWIHYHAFEAYLLITSQTLFMFTVERLVYIRNPTIHGQKFGKVSIAVMLVLPWIMTVLLGSISVFFDSEIITEREWNENLNENITNHTCQVRFNLSDKFIRKIIGEFIGAGLPILASLIISVVILCMWCCYKKKHSRGTNYALMGNQVEKAVRDSVIAVALLNFLFVVILVLGMLVEFRIPLSEFTLYGLIEGIVLMGTLANVRDKISAYCIKWCCRKKREKKTVRHAKDEDNVDLE